MKTIIIIFLMLFSTISFAEQGSDYKALDNAEAFFTNLKDKNYLGAWNNMTQVSKKTIVADVYDATKKIDKNTTLTKEQIQNDFDSCSSICTEYWSVFLVGFNPDFALNDSTWSFGASDKNYAEIILQYKYSDKPAVVKMYYENGGWKIGFTESFWLRKYFM